MSDISHDDLIDAAPEQHEELENVLHFLTQIDPVHWPSKQEARERIAAIRKVLDKARGK